MTPRERIRVAVVIGLFAAIFVALTVSSYVRESATGDEPEHLTAGYAILTLRDYRLDPLHPPLVRLWAALPLLTMRSVVLDTNNAAWLPVRLEAFCQQFLYQTNDADRLLYAARFMIVLLGVFLGVTLFLWARQLYGFWPAVLILLLYATEPNILAHARLVTTDFGATLLMFVALYFLWRTCRCLTWTNLAGLIVFFALAQIAKFSALSLWPMLLILLGIRVGRSRPWLCCLGVTQELLSGARKLRAALLVVTVLLGATYGAIWSVYGFRHAPAPANSGLARIVAQPSGAPEVVRIMNWLDERHLLPNAYAQGFLACRTLTGKWTAYLGGQVRDTGWWYYFPFAFLVKTPVALILLFVPGLVLVILQDGSEDDRSSFLLVPPAVYMAIAISAHFNIGLRHILPVYPFVLLVAGKAVQILWSSKRRALRIVLGALCLFQMEEVGFAYPHCLAFFNQFVGGPQNGYKYLADSNIDWGQDLKGLKQWMDQHAVRSINLSYAGHADPAYYGIQAYYLWPITPYVAGRETGPRLPGYVAVSVQYLLGLAMGEYRPDFYEKLRESQPVAVIGYSICVYWVDKPWW